MERQILSHQQDLASALAAAQALLRPQCGGTICLIQGHERQPAIRRNPQLLLVAQGLLWKLPAKMRKWSAKDLNIVCRIHVFPKAHLGTIHDLAEGCLKGAIHDPAEGHLNKT